MDAITLVKNNAAPGTDRFPAILLKECVEELTEPLYRLWRYSQDNGDSQGYAPQIPNNLASGYGNCFFS